MSVLAGLIWYHCVRVQNASVMLCFYEIYDIYW